MMALMNIDISMIPIIITLLGAAVVYFGYLISCSRIFRDETKQQYVEGITFILPMIICFMFGWVFRSWMNGIFLSQIIIILSSYYFIFEILNSRKRLGRWKEDAIHPVLCTLSPAYERIPKIGKFMFQFAYLFIFVFIFGHIWSTYEVPQFTSEVQNVGYLLFLSAEILLWLSTVAIAWGEKIIEYPKVIIEGQGQSKKGILLSVDRDFVEMRDENEIRLISKSQVDCIRFSLPTQKRNRDRKDEE